jgi:hypothetical protein
MFNSFRTKFYTEHDSVLQPHTLLSWFRCPKFTTLVSGVREWRFLIAVHLSLNCVSHRSRQQFVNALAFIPHQIRDYGVGSPAELARKSPAQALESRCCAYLVPGTCSTWYKTQCIRRRNPCLKSLTPIVCSSKLNDCL